MSKFLFIVVLLTAAFFRLYGLNWDQDQHLHPDERFLTMVATSMKWAGNYLDTSTSLLNPHNIGYGFYVYGTFPVIVVKSIAESLKLGDYNNLTLVGRFISGLLDLGTVILVFLISRRLFKSTSAALIAMFVYAISVLPIQLSHYFAVDTFLVFFLVLSFYFLITGRYLFLGIAYGLALSSKISAAVFAPIIAVHFLRELIASPKRLRLIGFAIIFSLICLFTIRLAYPYAFNGFRINPLLLTNMKQLKDLSRPDIFFPPVTMWINIRPGLFPLENMIYWGLGLPLGIISAAALFFCLLKYYRHPYVLFTVSWIILLFVYQSLQYGQPMRYFWPIYPFIAITSGTFLYQLFNINKLLFTVTAVLTLIWPVAFISIYSRPHSRVTASQWIYSHIPLGSKISCDHWDDCLPLGLVGYPPPNTYQVEEFPMFGADSDKWSIMNEKLAKVDYIVLSSNRLYGSVPSAPQRYPVSTRFYEYLFSNKLGFTPIAQFTSRPNIKLPGFKYCLNPANRSYGYVSIQIQDCPLPGISFVDDYADETFTVIDHPKIIIFKKVYPVDYLSVLQPASMQ